MRDEIEESEDERREGRGATDDVKSERVVQKKREKKDRAN